MSEGVYVNYAFFSVAVQIWQYLEPWILHFSFCCLESWSKFVNFFWPHWNQGSQSHVDESKNWVLAFTKTSVALRPPEEEMSETSYTLIST